MTTNNLLEAMIAQTKISKKLTDKQQKIIESAVKMFAEKGYSNTSTSEIAQAAGVAEGTIFRHYGTKSNLLLSVILPFLKDSLPSLANEVFGEVLSEHVLSFEEFLKALLKNRIAFLKENREIFQVVVKELMYNDELRNELRPIFSENVLKRIMRVVDMYKERGELRDIPSNMLLKLIFSLGGGYFISRFLFSPGDENTDDEAEVENLVRFIMDGIRKQ